ncbi:LEA type 2 family protein [Chitinophaga sp. NPDC101104]|uniref:LEA type 2 family protein n=1 Tax=Chitinophaga sp. NPDC101104 TaxID=3390561 RepID=UPI003CFDD673
MKQVTWYFMILLVWGGVSACGKMKDLEFIRVASFDMENLSFSKSTVKIELAYYNPNNFSLRLKDAEFDVFLDDTKVGHSLQDTLIDIPARDTFYFPVKLQVEMGNVFKNMLGVLANKEVTIKAAGNCKVGKKGVYLPFPIRCETKQKLDFF